MAVILHFRARRSIPRRDGGSSRPSALSHRQLHGQCRREAKQSLLNSVETLRLTMDAQQSLLVALLSSRIALLALDTTRQTEAAALCRTGSGQSASPDSNAARFSAQIVETDGKWFIV